jgi:hypothetical protein
VAGGLGDRAVAEWARGQGTTVVGPSEGQVIKAGFGEQLSPWEWWDGQVVLDCKGAAREVGVTEAVIGSNVRSPVRLDVGAE